MDGTPHGEDQNALAALVFVFIEGVGQLLGGGAKG